MKTDKRIANTIFTLTVLPNLIGVIMGLVGIRAYLYIIVYIISLVFCIQIIPAKHYGIRNIWSEFLFICYFLYTNTYTMSKIASVEKSISILYSIICPLLIIAFAVPKNFSIERVTKYYVLLLKMYSPYILIFLFFLLMLGFTEKSDDVDDIRQTIVGMRNPIWCSRYVGFLCFVPLLSIIEQTSKNKLLDVIGVICAFIIMIYSGSRGPILALLLVFAILVFPKLSVKYKILLFLMSISIVLAFFMLSDRYSSGSASYSDIERQNLIISIIDANFDLWRGIGIGSYQLYMTGLDELYYPHNLFLETYLETGFLGIALLFLFLYKIYVKRNKSFFFILCTFFFMNAQLSGDISGNNQFFIFAAICLLSNIKKNKIYANNKISHF